MKKKMFREEGIETSDKQGFENLVITFRLANCARIIKVNLYLRPMRELIHNT